MGGEGDRPGGAARRSGVRSVVLGGGHRGHARRWTTSSQWTARRHRPVVVNYHIAVAQRHRGGDRRHASPKRVAAYGTAILLVSSRGTGSASLRLGHPARGIPRSVWCTAHGAVSGAGRAAPRLHRAAATHVGYQFGLRRVGSSEPPFEGGQLDSDSGGRNCRIAGPRPRRPPPIRRPPHIHRLAPKRRPSVGLASAVAPPEGCSQRATSARSINSTRRSCWEK